MTDRELMQQALNALETLLGWQSLAPHEDQEDAKAAAFQLRARLSKCDRCGKVNPAEIHTCTPKPDSLINGMPAYEGSLSKSQRLAQREWQGLTDEDMNKLRHLVDWTVPLDIKKLASAIEAKLKEKNT